MNKIIICDKNKEYIDLIRAANITSDYVKIEIVCDDIIEVHKKNPGARIVTASNPSFSPDGGLDAILASKYPWNDPREFELTKDLFFVRSVDSDRTATEEIIFRALAGLFLHRHQGNFILPVLGCGIGAFAISKFVALLRRVLSSADLRYADLSSANLRSADLRSADLRSANLSYTNLSSADIRSANLSSTEFDGLTVNEWIKKYKVKKVDTKLILYKGVSTGFSSPQADKKIVYKIGGGVKEKLCSFSVADQCKPGLHVCPTYATAKEWGSVVLEVEVDIGDIVAIPAQEEAKKIRVKKLKPIKIVTS